jgi:hypothetical protein
MLAIEKLLTHVTGCHINYADERLCLNNLIITERVKIIPTLYNGAYLTERKLK